MVKITYFLTRAEDAPALGQIRRRRWACSTAIAIVPAIPVWKQPTLPEFGLLIAMGACGASAQTLMLRGFAVGETTVLVNFEYLQLLHAIVFGFIAFGDLPDVWTITGSIVIVLSAAYVARREAQDARLRAATRARNANGAIPTVLSSAGTGTVR